ncbi:hypothetical protein K431DRAFT_310322 [Polychaeton citri CBS 116435]|uniref:ATP-grasp domain-containing protein n=1 Tax=Polychaeton citri CBS 116435 TaxID=1314669 RepID=A0A9P4QGB1_9PEZI|nr:hypothetical protein K431DRAFT_310322 [Polychaeton citri CBS 116435]
MGSITRVLSGSKRTPGHFRLEKSFETLYSEGNEEDGPKTAQVVIMPTSTIQLTSKLPLPIRYPYQHLASDMDSETLARMFLQLVGQMTGMIAGNLPLVLFDLDETSASTRKHAHRDDAIQTFEQIAPETRPRLHFVASPEEVAAHIPSGGTIFMPNPMDFLAHLPHTIEPDVHYDLLSKRTLAISALPTPPSLVSGTNLSSSDLQDSSILAAEALRILQPLHERAIPFVVKLPQALAGTGTFLVRNETERQNALAVLVPEVKRMLAVVTPENAHLEPASVIYQELIPGPAVGFSLFVTKSGRWDFISCTRQIYDDSDGGEGWSGGYISYPEQEALRLQYADTADKLAAYIHSRNYHGPIGVDIMTGPDGSQYIIDMNVRITGTMPLGFWKSYFISRGLQEAVIFFPLILSVSRTQFQENFEGELQDGRIVVVGWSHDGEGKNSATIIMVAGSTPEDLKALLERLNKHKVQKESQITPSI